MTGLLRRWFRPAPFGRDAALRRTAQNLGAYVEQLEARADSDDNSTSLQALRMLIELGLRHEGAPSATGPAFRDMSLDALSEHAKRLTTLLERLGNASDAGEVQRLIEDLDSWRGDVVAATPARSARVPAEPPAEATPCEDEAVSAQVEPQGAPPDAAPPPPSPPKWTEDELAEVGVYRAKNGAWTHSLGDDHAQRIVSGAISREAALRAERQWKEEVHAMKRARSAGRMRWI